MKAQKAAAFTHDEALKQRLSAIETSGPGTLQKGSHFFGTSAEFWINLQSIYDLRVAMENVGDSLRSLARLKLPA